jgi:16S rRNA (cytidine1402-2'-O)-methyltransferase
VPDSRPGRPSTAPARSGRRRKGSELLYICPTPIGNLQDVTLRVLEVLRSAEVVACEDTRHTRILLDRHGIRARLMSFHDHNEEQRLAALLPLLREGKDVAVVSDAGMPGVSDPGFSLVRACASEDLPVTVLPGPSSVSTALVLSGLPADRFAFVGFLARSKSKLLEQVAAFDGTGAAVVAFESPRRVRASVAALDERWPERQMAVCRELTKIHEEAVRGTASQVLAKLTDPVRGEIVLVLEPAAKQRATGEDPGEAPRRALGELIKAGVGVKTAATLVAGLTDSPRRELYELGLRIKDQGRE